MSPLLLSGCNYSALESVRQGSAEKFRDAHNCHKGVIRGVISEIDKWQYIGWNDIESGYVINNRIFYIIGKIIQVCTSKRTLNADYNHVYVLFVDILWLLWYNKSGK